MCSFSEEMFLRDYFTFEATVGRFCDAEKIFNCLAGLYYIDGENAKRMFALVVCEKVRNIDSLKDYKLYRRLRRYSEACGLKSATDGPEDDILAIKGKALTVTSEAGLIDAGNNTKASVYANIVEKANAGQVTALRLIGVLQCEGIFFEKRVRSGLKNLSRAARWNSVESILALLKYDAANGKTYENMLYTLCAATPYEEISVKALNYRGAKNPEKINECILLSKVFGRGQANPNVYLPSYANVLYSEIISFKDKEKLLLSESKDAIVSYADLPLKLSMRRFSCDLSAINGLSITRKQEQNALLRNALNSDIRHFETFKPLCLCSDSGFMRNYYAEAVTKLYGEAHVKKISIADLNLHDFDPDVGNIFVRSCNEDKDNVFLIFFVGAINEAAAKEACDFLQSAKRGKMRLIRPGIEIDLGAVLPVCFCDKENAQMLAKFCDRIDIAAPDKNERKALLEGLIAQKQKQYGINGLAADGEVMEKLLSVSLDEAETALNLAIAANRHGDMQLTLTQENAGKFIKKRETSRGFGYGGYKDDN